MMILSGIVSSGMWASLGQIENLKAGTLAAFASCILDVQRAAVRRYGTIHLGGEKVKVCRRWHLSFTTCKSDQNTVKLFRSEMRVIEMRLVSKDYVLELLLLMAGFKDSAAPLAKTCLQTLRMADVAIRPVNPNCPQLCTLQFARLVAKRAGRFVGQCASLGHAVAAALINAGESFFSQEARVRFHAVVLQSFNCTMSDVKSGSGLEEALQLPFEVECVKAGIHLNKRLLHACQQLHASLSCTTSVILCGKSGAGKTTARKVLAQVLSNSLPGSAKLFVEGGSGERDADDEEESIYSSDSDSSLYSDAGSEKGDQQDDDRFSASMSKESNRVDVKIFNTRALSAADLLGDMDREGLLLQAMRDFGSNVSASKNSLLWLTIVSGGLC